jgi:hypothetical protein
LCNLECCAGKAPHASGSCMKGACQVTLPTSRGHYAAPARAEKFCGPPRKIHLTSVVLRPAEARLSTSSDHVSPSALEAACQADCGCASGSVNTNRSRNSAAFAGDSRPRPLMNNHLSDFRYHRIRILDSQCRQGAPRGPPVSFYLV